MKENLITMIIHHILGYKYFTVVYNVKGTYELGVGGRIFDNALDAMKSLQDNRTYSVFEIVSFRSRNRYITGTSPQGYACNYVQELTDETSKSTDKA